MGKLFKREIGITLIALVITIIVLLILAGVTVATLTGENGLLNKAATAREKNKEAEQDEKDKLSSYENELNNYNSSNSREISNEIKDYIDEKIMTSSYSEIILYEGSASSGNITFKDSNNNTRSTDEFDTIKFLIGNNRGNNKWDNLHTEEISKDDWDFAINNCSTNHWIIGLYGYADSEVGLYNLSKTGFSIGAQNNYSIARIYGINY